MLFWWKLVISIKIFLNNLDKTLMVGLVLHCENVIINLCGEWGECSMGKQYIKGTGFSSPRVSNPRQNWGL